MIVIKRINNNVVLVDDNDQRAIVTGKGVGFKAYPNDVVNESFIEQKFILEEDQNNDYYVQLLKEIPMECLNVSKEIVQMAEVELKNNFPTSLVFTLADHICFAIKRLKEGLIIDQLLAGEIKQFYPKEYEIGRKAVQLLKKEIYEDLSESESVSIAIHIVNSMGGLSHKYDIMDLTEAMAEIVEKMESFLQIKLNQESAIFARFITHLRYYLIRQFNLEIDDLMDDEMIDFVKNKYHKAYQCAQMVTAYVDERYGYDTVDSEKLYLALHINRFISNQKE